VTARDTAGGSGHTGSRLSLRLIGGSESLVSQGPLPPQAHGTQPASDAGDGALDGFLRAATSSAAKRRARPS